MGTFVVITMSIMGYGIGRIDNISTTFNHNFTTVTNDISSIKTDIEWIKRSLNLK